MNKAIVETMKAKGKWNPESEPRWLSKATIEEIEQREANVRNYEFYRLDQMYEKGKIDFENPPEMWRMTFLRWMLKRFGLSNMVSFLKTHDCKNGFVPVAMKLKAIGGVSDAEIEAALKEPEKVRVNKGSVCRLANRIARSVSRKDAFIQAWKIVKAGGYEVKVAGVSFDNRQEALKRLATYNPQDIHAVLVPEFDNPYDANAIAVQVMVDGQKGIYRLGYVPKTETAIVKAFLGTVPELKVIDGDLRGAKIRLAA